MCASLNERGIPTFAVDTCISPSHNVLLPKVEQKIHHWIRRGRVLLLWLGMPRTTFSRTRKHNTVGHCPLRSSQELLGVSGLGRRDRGKVEKDNQVFAFVMRILHTCTEFGVPYVVEHPLTSLLWEMPPLQRFCISHSPHFVDLDYCAYGENWRKPTKLMYQGLDLQSLGRRCSGHQHLCSFSKRRRVPLQGVNEHGVVWTPFAQPCPWSFCAAVGTLASALRG